MLLFSPKNASSPLNKFLLCSDIAHHTDTYVLYITTFLNVK